MKFYFMLLCFVLKLCILILLLGYNLVISDKKMNFMAFLCFCAMSHPAIRMSNLLIFADFSDFNFFC